MEGVVLQLVIGNKNYSSWSIRAWLYLVESGLDFSEVSISMFEGRWREQIAEFSPAGKVPILIDGQCVVWDSLAIIEHLRRTRKERGVLAWPPDPKAATTAQSVSYEMHSGFQALRDELPQNIRARVRLLPKNLSSSCLQQIQRIDEMWSEAYLRFGGPGLFGQYGIADVMYAPVALRLRTYGIEVSSTAQKFVDMVINRPAVRRLEQLAKAESGSLDFIDQVASVSPSQAEGT